MRTTQRTKIALNLNVCIHYKCRSSKPISINFFFPKEAFVQVGQLLIVGEIGDQGGKLESKKRRNRVSSIFSETLSSANVVFPTDISTILKGKLQFTRN